MGDNSGFSHSLHNNWLYFLYNLWLKTVQKKLSDWDVTWFTSRLATMMEIFLFTRTLHIQNGHQGASLVASGGDLWRYQAVTRASNSQ